MTYRTRIGILIGFVIVFLITAPIVVLYTAGYRWNDKKIRLEKVGIIFLRSRPSSANIYLDGKLRSEHSPARLRNLLPRTYVVKVAKTGFSSWQKSLSVSSALTTFAEHIVLWKNAKPEALDQTPAETLNQTELAMFNRVDQLTFKTTSDETFNSDGFEIWVGNKAGDHETVTRVSNEIRALLPYTDAGWVIYQTATEIHAIERDGRDTRNDATLATGNDLSGLALSSDGKYLYYASGTGPSAKFWRRQLQ